MTDSTDSTDSPEDARIAAAQERVLADARRARHIGDEVAARFDPRHGERDPTFDLDALGVQYTVTLLHDRQTGRLHPHECGSSDVARGVPGAGRTADLPLCAEKGDSSAVCGGDQTYVARGTFPSRVAGTAPLPSGMGSLWRA